MDTDVDEEGVDKTTLRPAARSQSVTLPTKGPKGKQRFDNGVQLGATSNTRTGRLMQQILLRKCASNTNLVGSAFAMDAPPPSLEIPMPTAKTKLLVVANRLPVTPTKDKAGNWELQSSAGGLVSALMGVTTSETTWIGWPGVWVEQGPDRDKLTAMLAEKKFVPVYMDPALADSHYNGFCNSILWQLFHYVPLTMETKLIESQTLFAQWECYQAANTAFADAVAEIYTKDPEQVVWVQDYHLMLLPAKLKKKFKTMKVGFFLHTPFPSSEIYRTLPVRTQVLEAVLKADLIGFHTYDYARHFVSACTRILGLEGTPEGVEEKDGHLTRVAAFPIGIDPERFKNALLLPEVQAHIKSLLARYGGRKVMLGVDRLDMIKGIPQKLLAFEKFLEDNPELGPQTLLVQIAVPSRTDVPEYQRLRSMVHEIVGRINGKHGTLTHVPIHHLDKQLGFHELCALYAVTDVLLVTSLRDGMNLVSYEFVACQNDNAGVLVLSEFAGAAQSLGAGAILINPWNIKEVSDAIRDAVNMGREDRQKRHSLNFQHITHHTSQTWADTFINELNDTHVEAEERARRMPPPLPIELMEQEFKSCKRRLLVLGTNSTLLMSPEEAQKQETSRRHPGTLHSQVEPTRKVLSSLAVIASDPDTVVVIFSGADKKRLQDLFGELPVWLAAENGTFVRGPQRDEEWELQSELAPDLTWMESVSCVLDYYCDRTPCSKVERRDTSLVWNYAFADTEHARLQARDLLQHVRTGPISNAPVDIVQGHRSVEVRPGGTSKGVAMQRILRLMMQRDGFEAVKFDFAMVVGHFLGRDENIFTYFQGQNINVGGNDHANPFARTESYRDHHNLRQSLDVERQRQLASLLPAVRTQDLALGLIAEGGPTSSRQFVPSEAFSTTTSGDHIRFQPCPLPALPPKHLYTVTVNRQRSSAEYSVPDSHTVADALFTLARCLVEGFAVTEEDPDADRRDADRRDADRRRRSQSLPQEMRPNIQSWNRDELMKVSTSSSFHASLTGQEGYLVEPQSAPMRLNESFLSDPSDFGGESASGGDDAWEEAPSAPTSAPDRDDLGMFMGLRSWSATGRNEGSGPPRMNGADRTPPERHWQLG